MADHPSPDWAAIEASPEFRALVRSRQRFATVAGLIGVGFGAVFVVLSHLADGAMQAKAIGGMSVGFAFGAVVVVVTWVITLLYTRRSKRVWAPLERAVRERAGA